LARCAFFRRWGGGSRVIGRFFGPLRAFVPLAAGLADMSLVTFQIVNITSALLWATGVLAPRCLRVRWLLENLLRSPRSPLKKCTAVRPRAHVDHPRALWPASAGGAFFPPAGSCVDPPLAGTPAQSDAYRVRDRWRAGVAYSSYRAG